MMTDGLMVSVSGVRGRVGEALTPEVITGFAAGFGAWAAAAAGAAAGTPSDRRGPGQPRVGPDVSPCGDRRAAVRGVRRHRRRASCRRPTIQLAVEWHHAAGGPGDHGQPQPDRVERSQVHRPIGALPVGGRGRVDARARWPGGVPRATWDRLGEVEPDRGRGCPTPRRDPGPTLPRCRGHPPPAPTRGAGLRPGRRRRDHDRRCSSAWGAG